MIDVVPRLLNKYREEIIPAMQETFGVKNKLSVPCLEKVVINMGVGEAINDVKILDAAMQDMAIIAGQKPLQRKSRKAISNFKLRAGMPVGCKVTLRGHKMYEFMDRLINICLPRIRDFNGVSAKSFDRQGNYSLGISDHAIFPEIETGRIQRVQGMDITFVFNRGPVEQTRELLRLFGMPFVKNKVASV